jgi:hypothetical protein
MPSLQRTTHLLVVPHLKRWPLLLSVGVPHRSGFDRSPRLPSIFFAPLYRPRWRGRHRLWTAPTRPTEPAARPAGPSPAARNLSPRAPTGGGGGGRHPRRHRRRRPAGAATRAPRWPRATHPTAAVPAAPTIPAALPKGVGVAAFFSAAAAAAAAEAVSSGHFQPAPQLAPKALRRLLGRRRQRASRRCCAFNGPSRWVRPTSTVGRYSGIRKTKDSDGCAQFKPRLFLSSFRKSRRLDVGCFVVV